MRIHPLILAALGLILLPFALTAVGLTTTSAAEVVIFALAATGLNLLAGYTGLVSFGHGAWFGIGAYAAALTALALPGNAFALPVLVALAVVAALSAFFGWLMLRRRGVYFSLMTLALPALSFTIAFRWTAVTGGENGLGGIERPVWCGGRPERWLDLLRRRRPDCLRHASLFGGWSTPRSAGFSSDPRE